MPMMIMMDGSPDQNLAFANEYDLNFPILSDMNMEVFDVWDPIYKTPSTTLIERGAVVHSIDETWHTTLLENLIYPE